MDNISVAEAGRIGGSSRSAKKISAAHSNIAIARRAAEQSPLKREAARRNIESARRRLAEIRAEKKLKNNT